MIEFLKKEFKQEWRNKHVMNGLLLYFSSSIFICYLSFGVKSGSLDPVIWNALFWIIILFGSINAVAKSFLSETPNLHLYYYSIISPQDLILSRMIYNTILLIILNLVGLTLYVTILGNPVQDYLIFSVNLILAAIGFSNTLTLVSAITSKSGGSQTLMAILSFPIILPLLLLVIKTSKNAVDGLERSSSLDELLTILAINIIVGTTSYLIFPYLWRT